MANHVTTEWHDVQVKIGNFTPIQLPETGEEVFQKEMKMMEGYEEKKNWSDEDSDPDLRIDSDDDSGVLKAYRDKRLLELKELAAKPKFGEIKQITKEDYVREINDAPKDVYVVLVLYQDYLEYSVLLTNILAEIAKKNIFVKFVKSIATKTIPEFSDDHWPGVLIYKNGEIVHQLIPALGIFGGKKVNKAIVEYVLAKKGIIESDIENDPRDELYKMQITKKYGKKEENEDESDDEERESRLYMHNHHFASYKD